MSSFWSGVIGALIGAVAGGAFTAWAGWWQSRGAYKAAAMQVGETLRIERELQHETMRHRAAVDLIEVNGDLFEQILHVYTDHPAHEHTCPHEYQAPAELKAAVRGMGRLYDVHSHWLSQETRRVIMGVLDLSRELVRPNPAHVWVGGCQGKACICCNWHCLAEGLIGECDQLARSARVILHSLDATGPLAYQGMSSGPSNLHRGDQE